MKGGGARKEETLYPVFSLNKNVYTLMCNLLKTASLRREESEKKCLRILGTQLSSMKRNLIAVLVIPRFS